VDFELLSARKLQANNVFALPSQLFA